jgi:opacity protein-like surface antigen
MLRPITAILLLVGAAPFAQAADNGFYLGAGYAQSDYGFSSPDDLEGFDDEDSGLKAIAGLRLLDGFGVEASFVDHGDVGIPPDICESVNDAPCDGDFQGGAETISGFAVGFLDFPVVDLFAKVGAASLRFDGSDGLGTRIEESGFAFAWGAGAQAHFLSLAARLEYEQVKVVEDEKLETISLSFIYTFL